MYIMGKTILCAGDCGKSMAKKDMNFCCYGEWRCNECMSQFVWEQESAAGLVGGDDPCDYE